MELAEIVLRKTKPETEWIDGRAVRKVSPTRTHARLQQRLGTALAAWAEGRGQCGPEWRFRLQPPGEARRPLVPDLAYVSDERLRGLTYAEAEAPAFAPDVAIEILSPEDRPARLAAKLRVYFACGTRLVAIVDPRHRTVRLVDHANDRTIDEPGRFAHEAMPGFALDLTTLFRALDLPG